MRKLFIILALILVPVISSCGDNKEKTEINDNNNQIIYITRRNNSYNGGRIIGSSVRLDDCNLRYLKYRDMSSTTLCSKPNCNHHTRECIAKQIGNCPILTNDYIYFFKSDTDVKEEHDGKRIFKIDSKLCKLSLNNSEIETVVGFSDCVPREYDGCLLIKDTLWFTGDNMDPHTDEYGVIHTSNTGGTHYLCSINLNTGIYTNYGSIYDGFNYDKSSHAAIIGYYNSKILINYEYELSPDCIDSDKPWFGMEELMFDFDPKTNEMTKSVIPSRPLWTNISSETIIYYDASKSKTVVLNKNGKYEFEIATGDFATSFNDKLFVRDTGKWYDLSNGSEHDLNKYSRNWEFVDYYDDSYIVTNYKEYIKLTEKELLALDKE